MAELLSSPIVAPSDRKSNRLAVIGLSNHATCLQIVGPKSTTVPQAVLDTMTRDGPLAQLIVKQIVGANADPENQLLYNPLQWNNATNVPFGATEDWLQPPVAKTINGRRDAFSQRCVWALRESRYAPLINFMSPLTGWAKNVSQGVSQVLSRM